MAGGSSAEATPAYSPPQRSPPTFEQQQQQQQQPAPTSLLPPELDGAAAAPRGLPPIPPPSAGRRFPDDLPALAAFRIPSWSTIPSNPTYHRVAHRRVVAAATTGPSSSSAAVSFAGLRRMVLERIDEEERSLGRRRSRPLEDPHLVGEVAARRARESRLARESADSALASEDRSWDWFLGSFARPSTVPFSRQL